MITRIKLENFKCFREVEVNPRLITVFVGPNGSGKSSVLQAMALLKQSAGKTGLDLNGDLIKFSVVDDINPKFDEASRTKTIGFAGVADQLELPKLGVDREVRYHYEADFSGLRLNTHYGQVRFKSTIFTFTIRPIDPEEEATIASTSSSGLGPHLIHLAPSNTIATIGEMDWGSVPAGLSKDALTILIGAPSSVLKAMRFVPSARGLVQPSYSLGDKVLDDISSSGGLSQQEQQIATNLAYTRELENKLSEWIKKVTEVGLRVNLIPSRTVEIQSTALIGNVNIVAEGFGTNALILLFQQLAIASKGATVMIEEPEIHLHPRAQADLASVLAEEAKAEDKQLIMTTHSEHILGRFLTLVAEKTLSPDELAIYAFEKDEQGVCTANELEVTEDGRVKGGIKDFLEPDLDELERYLRAMQPSE